MKPLNATCVVITGNHFFITFWLLTVTPKFILSYLWNVLLVRVVHYRVFWIVRTCQLILEKHQSWWKIYTVQEQHSWMAHLGKFVAWTTGFRSKLRNLHMQQSKTSTVPALESSMHGRCLEPDSHQILSKKKTIFCCFRIDGFLFARIWAFHLNYSKSTTFILHTTIRSCTHQRVGGVYYQPTVGNLELFVLSFCLRGICFNGRFFVFTPPRCCFTPKTVNFRVANRSY